MIEICDLKIVYDNKVLFEHFSESIASGAKVVITGASGTGKSTLLGCIAGFIRPYSGEVKIKDTPLTEKTVAALRTQMAWVPQEFTLPYANVREMVGAIFHLKVNKAKTPTKEQVTTVFLKLGLLPEIYEKKSTEISGGQRQRVMLAIALLLDKEILLLDEPTSALDAVSVGLVADCLRGMKDKTIVSVSHDDRFISCFDKVIKL